MDIESAEAKVDTRPEAEEAGQATAPPREAESAASQRSEAHATKHDSFLVGIGASAGGLKPLESFFQSMPPDTGASFVVVQHLSPDFKSLMESLLGRKTEMNVERVVDGVTIEPNRIYLIPPKKNMVVEGNRLRLYDQDSTAHVGPNFPIDRFFESLGREFQNRAIAVVLSGTGTDGTRGVRTVSENGGLVMVQSEQSAEFDGMPRAAIGTGLVDHVLDPVELAQAVARCVKSPPERILDEADAQSIFSQGSINQILRLLKQNESIDFTVYKSATLARRIERRMLLGGHRTIDAYLRELSASPAEQKALCQDLLINVTQFFRDKAAWASLATKVIDPMVVGLGEEESLRVWVTACSTGEEAYSVAILLKEAMERHGVLQDVKVFATDVDKRALATAAAGVYPMSIADDVGPERLRRFFTARGDAYAIKRQIRDMVIFARHDLTRDAPFTRMHLVTCRNTLIYLKSQFQQQAVAMLHYALKINGKLMLGVAETPGDLEEEFNPLDRQMSIYEKKRDVRLSLTGRRPSLDPKSDTVSPRDKSAPPPSLPTRAQVLTEGFEAFLADRAAACLIVSGETREVLEVFGKPENLLRVPTGGFTRDVERMIIEPLALPLNTALHRARDLGEAVRFTRIPLPGRDGEPVGAADLRVRYHAAHQDKAGHFTVLIETQDEPSEAEPFDAEGQAAHRITQLEEELQHTRVSLQTTIEELESTNEEQQATNQELIAANEELQSTNEELHSVNEELYTVNSEYQLKNQELTDLNNDVENLLRATDVGTVFLDSDLRVRKFTPTLAMAINLDHNDLGRPIQHFSHNLRHPGFVEDLRRVQQTGERIERHLETYDGRFLLMRIYPYHAEPSPQRRGVVCTFVDITDLARTENALREANTKLRAKNREVEEFIYTVSHDLKSPLVTIGGMLGLIRQGLGEEAARSVARFLDVADKTIHDMRGVIDDLLNLSRLGMIEYQPESVDPTAIVRDLLERMAEELEAKRVEVSVQDAMPAVHADTQRLRQVFQNLLSNAIHYGCVDADPARIEVSARRHEGEVQLCVRDFGPGVPGDFHEKIFGLFTRLNPEQSGGTGVGLTIVKHVAEKHGGRAWVESPEGGGAAFWIALPNPAMPGPSPDKPPVLSA